MADNMKKHARAIQRATGRRYQGALNFARKHISRARDNVGSWDRDAITAELIRLAKLQTQAMGEDD